MEAAALSMHHQTSNHKRNSSEYKRSSVILCFATFFLSLFIKEGALFVNLMYLL